MPGSIANVFIAFIFTLAGTSPAKNDSADAAFASGAAAAALLEGRGDADATALVATTGGF